MAGIVHRRGKKFSQGHGAKPAGQLGPGGRRAGHHHRQPALRGHGGIAHLPHLGGGEVLGRKAAGVQGMELALCPDQGKGVAAQAVAGGLQKGQGRRHGHRRVHGVAALFQDVQPDAAGLGDGGTHHPPVGKHRVAPGGVSMVAGIKRNHTGPSFFFLYKALPDLAAGPFWFAGALARRAFIVPYPTPPGQSAGAGPPHPVPPRPSHSPGAPPLPFFRPFSAFFFGPPGPGFLTLKKAAFILILYVREKRASEKPLHSRPFHGKES